MKPQEPRQAHATDAADAAQREAFELQAPDQLLLIITDVLRVGDKLAPALKAAVILLPIVGVPVHFDMR
jgi:hypothetical protein